MAVNKIDVPAENWDKLFAPSACLVTITTADNDGRVNAASYGTCVRVCHDPVYLSFTTAEGKDTYNNILANGEFVVNVPSHDREILEKVRVCGLEFPPGVNELEKAGLTALASKAVKPMAPPTKSRNTGCPPRWSACPIQGRSRRSRPVPAAATLRTSCTTSANWSRQSGRRAR